MHHLPRHMRHMRTLPSPECDVHPHGLPRPRSPAVAAPSAALTCHVSGIVHMDVGTVEGCCAIRHVCSPQKHRDASQLALPDRHYDTKHKMTKEQHHGRYECPVRCTALYKGITAHGDLHATVGHAMHTTVHHTMYPQNRSCSACRHAAIPRDLTAIMQETEAAPAGWIRMCCPHPSPCPPQSTAACCQGP